VVGITSYPANNRDGDFSGDIPRIFYNAVMHTASQLRVLIALADDTSNGTTLQSELQAFGIPTVDLMDVNIYTPTLAELQSYDVVITWPNVTYNDKAAMGDVLADYVDVGGGVVLGSGVWYDPFDLAGRIQDPGYSPFEQAGPMIRDLACLGTYDPGHSLMAGVTTACDELRDDVTVESGATLVASWDDGQPFVGVNAAGNVVGITSWPHNMRHFTGDVARVFYNAVIYTSQAGRPGISCLDVVETLGGSCTTIPGGFEITSTGANLEYGGYTFDDDVNDIGNRNICSLCLYGNGGIVLVTPVEASQENAGTDQVHWAGLPINCASGYATSLIQPGSQIDWMSYSTGNSCGDGDLDAGLTKVNCKY
jgi:hypothetical protein